jgi:hypothetical protein
MLGVAAPAEAKFSVAPTVIDVAREPDDVAVGTISVMLNGERGRRFAVDVEDLGQDPEGAFTFSEPGPSQFSAARWISLSPRSFRGTPDRTQPVELRVRVPRRAEPGDHVASLTVKRLDAAKGGRTAIVQALAVRLTVRVKGALRPAAELRALRAHRTAGGGPVTGMVTVLNKGNVRLDFDGGDVGALAVLAGERPEASIPFSGVLYPGHSREYRLSWDDPPPIGRFRVKAVVRTARGIVSATDSFWILPWRQAVAGLLVVFAAVVFVGGRRRARRSAR